MPRENTVGRDVEVIWLGPTDTEGRSGIVVVPLRLPNGVARMAKSITNQFRNAAPSTLHQINLFLLSTIFKNNYLAKKLKTISDLADFQQWIIKNQVNFGKSYLFFRREKLWKKMIETVCTDNDIVIIELGVAWGYTTNWFAEKGFSLLSKHHDDVDIQMESFDLFTGLPIGWRNHPQGHFSNNGVAPDIADHRVKFHIGFVEETIGELDLRKLAESQLVVLFDLDLFNPTLSVYNHIKNSVTVGDIFYFDEAFDHDERAIIRDYLMKDFEIELIGITPLAFAAKIVRIRTNAL